MNKKTLDELEVLMEYAKGSGCGIDPDQVMKLHQNVLKAQQRKSRKEKKLLIDDCWASLEDVMRTDSVGNSYIDEDALEEEEKRLHKKYNCD